MSNRRRLKNLYLRRGGLCFWCGRHTVLVIPWKFKNKNGQIIDKAGRGGWQKSGTWKKLIDQIATVDHFVDRALEMRLQIHDKTEVTTLACHHCNKIRQQDSMSKINMKDRKTFKVRNWRGVTNLD